MTLHGMTTNIGSRITGFRAAVNMQPSCQLLITAAQSSTTHSLYARPTKFTDAGYQHCLQMTRTLYHSNHHHHHHHSMTPLAHESWSVLGHTKTLPALSEHTYTIGFLFNQPIFPELLQVRLVPQSKLLGTDEAVFLYARYPSCFPTNGIKAPKDKIWTYIYKS